MTDANPTSGAAQTRRWFRRPWVIIAAAVLLIVGGVWANHLRERAKGRREIEKRLDVLRAMGVTVTPAELAAKYPDPPPEKDARRLLQPGLAELNDPGDGNRIPFFGGGYPTNRLTRLSDEQRAEARSYLDEQAKALARIPDLKLEGAWFGSGFANWSNYWTTGPSRDGYRLVKLLHLMALMDIEDGRALRAVSNVSRAHSIASAIRSEIFVNHVTIIAFSGRSIAVVERLLNRASLTDGDLRKLMAVFNEERPTGFRNGLENLTVDCVEGMFEARRLSKMSMLPSSASDDPWIRTKDWFERLYASSRMKAFSDDEFCRILEFRADQFEALEMEPTAAVAKLREIGKEANLARADVVNGKVSWGYQSFGPQVIGIIGRFSEDQANRTLKRATRTGLAIERYRLARANALPESLSALVPVYLPAVPLDLFDGQPLRYRKLPRGYVVYSIGSDLSDDGGKESPVEPMEGDHYDLTFTVERPE